MVGSWVVADVRVYHEGRVLFGVLFLNLPEFIRVKDLVVGWARRVLANMGITLLCLLVIRLFVCLIV